jgi:hypothetical protein
MKKFYIIDAEVMIAEMAKLEKGLPKQQVQILQAMVDLDRPATGTEIIAHAVNRGLTTRQRYDVLYAWYARSNEKFGVTLKS